MATTHLAGVFVRAASYEAKPQFFRGVSRMTGSFRDITDVSTQLLAYRVQTVAESLQRAFLETQGYHGTSSALVERALSIGTFEADVEKSNKLYLIKDMATAARFALARSYRYGGEPLILKISSPQKREHNPTDFSGWSVNRGGLGAYSYVRTDCAPVDILEVHSVTCHSKLE